MAHLEPAGLAASTANPGWAVRDVVAHLAGVEHGHQQMIRALLAGQAPDLLGFDLDAFNAADVAARQGASLATLLGELASNRNHTLALLERVGPDDWQRDGYHPGASTPRPRGYSASSPSIEKRHAKDIRAALSPSA